MNLLKIGPLNGETERWLDALSVFDHIYIVMCESQVEPRISNDRVSYIYLKSTRINKILLRAIKGFSRRPKYNWILKLLIPIASIYNKSLIKELSKLNYDEVHISYNDFDESGTLGLILQPQFKKNKTRITRAYKETRPSSDEIEKLSLSMADRIVLNDEECKLFFENKYGSDIFSDKDVVCGLDEDWLWSETLNMPIPNNKLSDKDNRQHIVILAGRVMSDSSDERSGSRLYYIPMIKGFIDEGFVVHLHTLRVIKDANGVDQYDLLQKQYPHDFYIERPLSLQGDEKKESYEILKSYNFGIMHNYIEGTSNTEFDKFNIPHRYYEYNAMGVIPLLEAGKTVLLEKLLNETRSGCVYSSIQEIKEFEGFVPYIPSFADYISELYG